MSSSPRAADKGLEIAPTTDRPSSELSAGQQAITATKLSDHTSGQCDETRTPKGEEAVKLSRQEASGTSPQGSTGRPPTASQSLSGEKRWDGKHRLSRFSHLSRGLQYQRTSSTELTYLRTHYLPQSQMH